jgi:hypothetical protein
MSGRRSPVTREERDKLDQLIPSGWFQCPECGAISLLSRTGDSHCINEFNSEGIPRPYCRGKR